MQIVLGRWLLAPTTEITKNRSCAIVLWCLKSFITLVLKPRREARFHAFITVVCLADREVHTWYW